MRPGETHIRPPSRRVLTKHERASFPSPWVDRTANPHHLRSSDLDGAHMPTIDPRRETASPPILTIRKILCQLCGIRAFAGTYVLKFPLGMQVCGNNQGHRTHPAGYGEYARNLNIQHINSTRMHLKRPSGVRATTTSLIRPTMACARLYGGQSFC